MDDINILREITAIVLLLATILWIFSPLIRMVVENHSEHLEQKEFQKSKEFSVKPGKGPASTPPSGDSRKLRRQKQRISHTES